MKAQAQSFALALALLAIGESVARAAENKLCEELLRNKGSASLKLTQDTTAYLTDLFKKKTINEAQLRHMLAGLKRGELINPITEDEASEKVSLHIHRAGIARFLEKKGLDLRVLRMGLEHILQSHAQTQVSRTQTEDETEHAFSQIEFVPIPPAKFEMGEDEAPRAKIELTHSIEVMSTFVTQAQWVKIFGVNPSEFSNGPQSVVLTVNDKKVTLQPDHPVEKITWWSAVVFANKLSELHGLTPAYDLSAVKWKPGTQAEDGTLVAIEGEVRVNSHSGDLYQTSGFRIPTEAELEELQVLERNANGKLDHKKRGWSKYTAKGSTARVAELEPLNIEGKEIFDIVGNVWHWGHDWYADDLKSGVNPSGPAQGKKRILSGGSWNSESDSFVRTFRHALAPDTRYSNIGVRLVRTLR